MKRLDGHVALVSGGASGIGRAIVERFAVEGAFVYVGDIDLAAAERLAASVGGRAVHLDVTGEDSWCAAADRIVGSHLRLDVLVNCAGIDGVNDNIDECSDEEWQRVMRVNLDGTFLGAKTAVRVMRTQGSGSIINISSVLAVVADGEALAYTASKGAVRALTKSVALEVGGLGVRCNSIHPGYIHTPMTERWIAERSASGEALDDLIALHPLGRLGTPGDVAGLALFLATDESAFVNGAELAIDGGYLAV